MDIVVNFILFDPEIQKMKYVVMEMRVTNFIMPTDCIEDISEMVNGYNNMYPDDDTFAVDVLDVYQNGKSLWNEKEVYLNEFYQIEEE